MLSKIIKFCKYYEKDLILSAIIIIVALISFGLGRLSKIRENKTPITIETAKSAKVQPWQNIEEEERDGIFVASKNGAKYHFPWCPGAQRIKESNKIWFSTKTEAETAGYTPAANCKGL